jgi:hypothetical protein
MVTLLDATGPTCTSIALRLLRHRSTLAVEHLANCDGMDETPEPTPHSSDPADPPDPSDPPERSTGADGPRRSSTRKRRAPAAPPSDGETDQPVLRATAAARTNGRAQPPARRWWEHPWLWFGVVIVVIGVAVGVSLLVDSDPNDIKPVGDTTAFCAAVTSYKGVRDQPTSDASGSEDAAADAKLRASLGAVQQASPPEIRPTTDEIASALDRVIAVRTQSSSTGVDQLATQDSMLSSIDAAAEPASERFSKYVQRACGFDIAATPASVPAPSGSGPPPTPNPNGATLVTPAGG